MNIVWSITVGQVLTIAVPIVAAVGGIIMTGIMQKTKKAVLTELDKKLGEHRTHGDTKLIALETSSKEVSEDLKDFKEHVARHFVEKNELGELRNSVDKSIDRMQASLDLAVATMGDVRDSVIVLTAKGGKTTVPPQRRRPAKTVA